jgi:hypothetical protein
MKRCISCDRELEDNAKGCVFCGTTQPSSKPPEKEEPDTLQTVAEKTAFGEKLAAAFLAASLKFLEK